MQFLLISFHRTPLHAATDKGNIEVVRLLLTKEDINVNIISI